MRSSKKEFQTPSNVALNVSHSITMSSRSGSNPSQPKATAMKYQAQTSQHDSVLFLKQSHARFNAPSKKESIFFDECNREIISLTCIGSDSSQPGKTRVVVQQMDKSFLIELILPVGKKVLSVKFNPTRSVIAYHVERNIVEFINIKEKISDKPSSSSSSSNPFDSLTYVLEEKRYVQSSRAKNSKLIGFLWTGPSEVVLITDLSVEYYQVDISRRRLSLVKLFQSTTNWFVFQPSTHHSLSANSHRDDDKGTVLPNESNNNSLPYSLLIVSTGSLGNSMQPYLFSNSRVTRLQKFDVEGNWRENDKLELFERSITVGYIYGYVRLLILQHESLNIKSKGAQIVLYTIDSDSGITTKTHTLDLDTSGRFAINILDNLVIAHDQPSKASFIFDIAIKSTEKSDCPTHFVSLIDRRPIRAMENNDDKNKRSAEMYSLNWVFFQPNFIVDARHGSLATLMIDLDAMQNVLQDSLLRINFLARRSQSERIILSRCRKIVCDSYKQATDANTEPRGQQANPLADVSSAFEILSNLIKSAPVLRIESDSTTTKAEIQPEPINVEKEEEFGFKETIHQEDVDREVFRHLLDLAEENLEKPAHFHFVSSVLLEFILAVRCKDDKSVDFCIYERLVKCLARGKRFYQIIQMIRSEILKDSKQLACLLISLRDQYKFAGQLGLDMFHRLPCGLSPSNLEELVQV